MGNSDAASPASAAAARDAKKRVRGVVRLWGWGRGDLSGSIRGEGFPVGLDLI